MLNEISVLADAPASRRAIAPRHPGFAADRESAELVRPAERKVGGLVLTRHLGESIMIGDEVEVQVVEVKSGIARLKIVAPRSIPVHRREVFDSIQAGKPRPEFQDVPRPSNRPASKSSGGLVLARSVYQSIMIGGEVEVSVVEVRPSAVKLQIAAPRSIAVHRREVFDRLDDPA
jgi:carbon storage regulator CsrA